MSASLLCGYVPRLLERCSWIPYCYAAALWRRRPCCRAQALQRRRRDDRRDRPIVSAYAAGSGKRTRCDRAQSGRSKYFGPAPVSTGYYPAPTERLATGTAASTDGGATERPAIPPDHLRFPEFEP